MLTITKQPVLYCSCLERRTYETRVVFFFLNWFTTQVVNSTKAAQSVCPSRCRSKQTATYGQI